MQVTIELQEKHLHMLEDEIGIVINECNGEYDAEDISYAITTLIELNEVN